MFQSLLSSARRRNPRRQPAQRLPAYHRRLACEPLEDRRLLSIVINNVWSEYDDFRFIAGDGIPTVENQYEAHISGGTPAYVDFLLGGQERRDTDPADGWTAIFDMSSLTSIGPLEVRAYDASHNVIAEYTHEDVNVLPLPTWFYRVYHDGDDGHEHATGTQFDATWLGWDDGYQFDVFIADIAQSYTTPDREKWWILGELETGFRAGPTFRVTSDSQGVVSSSDLGYLFEAAVLNRSVFRAVVPFGVEGKWEFGSLVPTKVEWGNLNIERLPDSPNWGIDSGWYIQASTHGHGFVFNDDLLIEKAEVTASITIGYEGSASGKSAFKIQLPEIQVPALAGVGVPPGVVDVMFGGSVDVGAAITLDVTGEMVGTAYQLQSTELMLEFGLGVTGFAEIRVLAGFAPLGGRLRGGLEQGLGVKWSRDQTWVWKAPGSLDLTAEVYSAVGWGSWQIGKTWWSNTWNIAEWDFLKEVGKDDEGSKGEYHYDVGEFYISNLSYTYPARLSASQDLYGFEMPTVLGPATITLEVDHPGEWNLELTDQHGNVVPGVGPHTDSSGNLYLDVASLDAGEYYKVVVHGPHVGADYELTFDIQGPPAPLLIDGTAEDDTLLVIPLSDTSLKYQLNNAPFVEVQGVSLLYFDGGDGDDRMIVDFAQYDFDLYGTPGYWMYFDGRDGDDRLVVDFADHDLRQYNGLVTSSILFDGGAGADTLEINGGTFSNVDHFFLNANDGWVDLDGHYIDYWGLAPIFDNVSVTDREFIFLGAAETVSMRDDGTAGNGVSFIQSTWGESVSFTNPTNSLTIDTTFGGGPDTINIEGLDSLFDGDLYVFGKSNDSVRFRANATNLGSRNLTISAGTVTQTEDSPITAAGLELLGKGSHTLNHEDNAITTLAGDTESLEFHGKNAFSIGTVNDTSGLTATGAIKLSAGGAVTQTAPIEADRLELRGGPYTLTHAQNNVAKLVIHGTDNDDTLVLTTLTTKSFDYQLNTATSKFAGKKDITSIEVNTHAGDDTMTLDLSQLSNSFGGNIAFDGGAGVNRLIGPNQNNAWTISGLNSGTLGTNVEFANIQKLTGGSEDDVFTFQQNGRLTSVDGAAGTDTVNVAAWTGVVDATLTGNEANGFGGSLTHTKPDTDPYTVNFSRIERLEGKQDDKLRGLNVQSVWSIKDPAAREYRDVATDTVRTLQFTGFSDLYGGTAVDELIGPDQDNTWTVSGENSGSLNANIMFSGMENLTGGSKKDDFTFGENGRVTKVDGRGGHDTVDVSSWTGVVNATLKGNDENGFEGSLATVFKADNNGNGENGQDEPIEVLFAGIEHLAGKQGDTLRGLDVAAVWTINDPTSREYRDTAADRALTFAGFSSLHAGTENDTFNLEAVNAELLIVVNSAENENGEENNGESEANGLGGDVVNVAVGNLDTVTALVTMQTKAGSEHRIYLNDGGNDRAVNYELTPTSVTSTLAPVLPPGSPPPSSVEPGAARPFAGIVFDVGRNDGEPGFAQVTLSGTTEVVPEGAKGPNGFKVTPSEFTTFILHGNDPTFDHADADPTQIDLLEVVFAGTTKRELTYNGRPDGDGVWKFGNRQSIEFTGIEKLNYFPVVAVSQDAGLRGRSEGWVRVYDAELGDLVAQIQAYLPDHRTGVTVTLADINGNGIPEVITAPGVNHSPQVKVFQLHAGGAGAGSLVDVPFLAYDHNFRNGLQVAAGNVVGDFRADIVTVPTRGVAEVRVFENQGPIQNEALVNNGSPITPRWINADPARQFAAFDTTFIGGASVAVGDLMGFGGAGQIVVGSGSGMRATVNVFDVFDPDKFGPNDYLPSPVRQFFPFGDDVRGGVDVALGRVRPTMDRLDQGPEQTLDQTLDLIAGAARRGGSQVEVLDGRDGALLAAFQAYDDRSLNAPVRVAAKDINGDGMVSVFTAQGTDGRSGRVKRWDLGDPLNPSAVDFLLLDQSPDWPGFFLG